MYWGRSGTSAWKCFSRHGQLQGGRLTLSARLCHVRRNLRLDRPDAQSVASGQYGSWNRLHRTLLDSRCRTHWLRRRQWYSIVAPPPPPLLPVSMDIIDVDLSAIRTSTMSAGAGAFPPEGEQSFVGGGGDLLSLICPELGVTPLTDPGTDLEDELPTLATSPVTVDHGAAPRSTPLSDPERGGGRIGSPAGYAVPVIANVSDRTTQPLVVTSPAGPTDMDPAIPRPSTMGCSAMPSSVPVVSTTEWSPSSSGLLLRSEGSWGDTLCLWVP